MEAVILNFIDDLDSKINGVQTHIDREPDSDSSWTQYHRLYDRYFYKGTSAASTAVSGDAAPVEKQSKTVASTEKSRYSQPRTKFSNTLGDQLKAKNLGLTEAVRQDNKDD
jgi:3'-5' exoribonuclease